MHRMLIPWGLNIMIETEGVSVPPGMQKHLIEPVSLRQK